MIPRTHFRLQHAGRRLSSGLCLAVMLTASTALAQDPTQIERNRPDFRSPPRAYEEVTVDGRIFIVEKQLLDEDPCTAQRALARLNKNIDMALALLPRHAHRHVARQQFWLLYGEQATGGGEANGLTYFRPGSPRYDEKRDERWESVVVVYSAENYAKLTDLWALKSVLHELGHAYQLEQWPERQADILAAYEHAMSQHKYHDVRNDQRGIYKTAYAAANQLEYFAELTCMYFAECNYEPYNRQALKAYDPEGYAMIRKMWKIGDQYGEHEPRTWTIGCSGDTLKATFKELEQGRVTLTAACGRERTFALSQLGPLDRDYIERWFDE